VKKESWQVATMKKKANNYYKNYGQPGKKEKKNEKQENSRCCPRGCKDKGNFALLFAVTCTQ